MVLVDTSVWIEVFRRPSRVVLEVLHYDRDYDAIAKISALRARRVTLR